MLCTQKRTQQQKYMPTEIRTFHGDTTGHAFDGYAGFRIGQPYQLTYTREFDEVRLVLDHHAHVSPGGGAAGADERTV